jgi:hypothetical protein
MDDTKFKPLTADIADMQPALNERGYLFTLFHTVDAEGNPTTARVKRMTLAERATIAALPSLLQSKFLDIARKIQEQSASRNRDQQLTKERVLENAGRQNDQANLYVCAGFIEPRVYLTQKEAAEHGGIFVERIAYADRSAFAQLCEESSEEAASRFRPISERPADDVSAGPNGDAVSGADQPVEVSEAPYVSS